VHKKEKKKKLAFYDKINEIITNETKLQAKIIFLGDLNIDYEVMKKEVLQNHVLKWKFKLFTILSKFNFKDGSKLFHKDNIMSTWKKGDNNYRLNYIWISNNLISEIIYSSTNKPHIFGTDHKAITAYFRINHIFYNRCMAIRK
jgi:exonuclease III